MKPTLARLIRRAVGRLQGHAELVMRHYIVITTFILLVISFFFAVAWLYFKPDWEPALTSVALLATITGLFIDRWLAAKERRRELLFALAHEVYMNLNVLSDPLFKPDTQPPQAPSVYPRLYTATLDTVIASGVFTQLSDRKLFRLMHSWRQRASEFNHRLDITELFTFGKPEPEVIASFRAVLTSGIVLSKSREVLTELAAHLMDNYARESGVSRDTILFPDDNMSGTA